MKISIQSVPPPVAFGIVFVFYVNPLLFLSPDYDSQRNFNEIHCIRDGDDTKKLAMNIMKANMPMT